MKTVCAAPLPALQLLSYPHSTLSLDKPKYGARLLRLIMLSLSTLVSAVSPDPGLYSRLTYLQLSLFLTTASRFASVPSLVSPRTTVGLPPLPQNVLDVISAHTELPPADVKHLWTVLGPSVMHAKGPLVPSQRAIADTLASLSPSRGLGTFLPSSATHSILIVSGVEVLAPPVQACVTPGCKEAGRPLGGHKRDYLAYAYTCQRGVLPIRVFTLYCECESSHCPTARRRCVDTWSTSVQDHVSS